MCPIGIKISMVYAVAFILMTTTVTSHKIHKPILKLVQPKTDDPKCSLAELKQEVNVKNCSSDERDFMKENESCWVTLKQSEDEKDKHLLDVFSKVETLKCNHGRWSGTDSSSDISLHRSKRGFWSAVTSLFGGTVGAIFGGFGAAIGIYKIACHFLCDDGNGDSPAPTPAPQTTTPVPPRTTTRRYSPPRRPRPRPVPVPPKSPPKFVACRPADLQQEYNPAPGQTSVVVTWLTPVAADSDSSTPPTVTLDEGTHSGGSFEGSVSGKQHSIRYKAKDSDGLTAYCYFSFTVKVLSCSSLAWPTNGKVDCPNEHILGSSCNYSCDDGYRLSGDTTIICGNASSPVWSTETECDNATAVCETPVVTFPTCDRITCSAPDNLTNGFAVCEDMSYTYASVCSWKCNDGYRLEGNLYIQCEADGQWTSSNQSICIDDGIPTLNCLTPHVFYADKGLSNTDVVWDVPMVNDTIDTEPTLMQTEGLAIGSSLEVGSTIVKYKAIDYSGNESPECTIELRVEEIKCRHPLDALNDTYMVFSCTGLTYAYGDSCTLSCNHNFPLNGTDMITCEKQGPDDNPTGVWDWGTGHQPICEEIECPELDPPKNGVLLYNAINYAPVATMVCNENFDIPELRPRFSGTFFCYVDGTWGPLDYVPPCSEERIPQFDNLPTEIYYYSGDCNSAETQEQIRQNFQTILNSTLAQRCPTGETCYVGEMTIHCGPTSGRKKRDLNESLQRRSTMYENIDIQNSRQVTEEGNPSKHELFKRQVDETHLLVIEFPINVLWVRGNMSASAAYGHYDDILLLVLKPAVQSLIDNGSLDIPDFSLKSDSFQTARYGSLVCGDGEYLDRADCMPCPAGHYLVDNACARCPIGTYMDGVGSVQCTSCPDGFTTNAVGSKSSTDCLEVCSLGYYSPDGLAKCSACPIGTYQDQYQSTNCTQCPMDTTTLSTNSLSAVDCQNFDVWFSETLEEDVTMANISTSMSDMAVMFWAKPQGEKSNMTMTINSRYEELVKIQLGTDILIEVLSTGSEIVGAFRSTSWTHIAVSIDLTTPGISIYVNGMLMHEFNGVTHSSLYTVNGSVVVSSTGTSGVYMSGFHLRNKIIESNVESESLECHVTSTDDVISMNAFLSLQTQGITAVVPSACDAINECFPSPCGSHTCINEVGGFTCICAGGYTGDTCTIPPDYCINNECVSGSTCQSGSTFYTCECNTGYSGAFCEIAPVDGGWSYSTWTNCDVTCGSGTQSRVRSCDSPVPDEYGLDCVGDTTETVSCNTKECKVCVHLQRGYGTLLNCTTANTTGTQTCDIYCSTGKLMPKGLKNFNTYRCGIDTEYDWEPMENVPNCKDATRPDGYIILVSTEYQNPITDDDEQLIINSVESNAATTGCGQTSGCQIVAEVTSSRRRRRNTGGMLTLSFEIELEETDGLQIEQFFTDQTVSSSLHEVVDAIYVLESTAAYINTSSSSIFDVTVNGVTYTSDVNSVQITGVVTCDIGLVSTEGLCVQCPIGTYADGDVCRFCDVGSYQPTPGQTECITCPAGITTTTVGSMNVLQCSDPVPSTGPVSVDTPPVLIYNKPTEENTDPKHFGMYIGIGIAVIAFILSVIAISIVCFKKHSTRPFRSISVLSFDNFRPRTGDSTMSGFPVQGVAQ